MPRDITGLGGNSQLSVAVDFVKLPIVDAARLTDPDDPINQYSVSGKEMGASVWSYTENGAQHLSLVVALGKNPTDPWVDMVNGSLIITVDDIEDAGIMGATILESDTATEVLTALDINPTVFGKSLIKATSADATLTNLGATAVGSALFKALTGATALTAMGVTDPFRDMLRATAPTAAQQAAVATLLGNATVTARGMVQMTNTVAGIAPATSTADTASTATDVATLLVDLNDLITKYNQVRTDMLACRTTTNALLVAMRASGQLVA